MSVLKKYNEGTSQWEAVVVGKQGNSGVVAVTAPITNSGTSNSAVLGFNPNYLGQAAGRNAIINGGFDVWQRGAGPFTGAGGGYTADRFLVAQDAGSFSATKSTFTPGSAPVAGVEGTNYLTVSFTNSAGAAQYLTHKIEGVRTFAGQTVTLSYWAKVSTPVTNTPLFVQNFGSGGSSNIVTTLPNISLTTTWTRYTQTFAIPSISGKTIGTNDLLEFQLVRIAASTTLDIWGVQLELGSVATPSSRAGGTLTGEIMACQRYFSKSMPIDIAPGASEPRGRVFLDNISGTTRDIRWPQWWPVPMRSTPTITVYNVTGGSPSPTVNNDNTGTSGTLFYSALGANVTNQFQWTANSEL